MLISFSLANYKSFKGPKTLDLAATIDKEHVSENTFLAKDLRLLKSVAIYGANASGKTNLLDAIAFMKYFVLHSTDNQVGDSIPITNFKLDSKMQAKPSKLEVIFVVENTKYEYSFEVNADRVTKELLQAYQTTRPQLWFERLFDSKKQTYSWKFGSKFKGQIQSWKEQTLENTLFLSRASQLNSEQLKPVHQWFNNLKPLNLSKPLHPGHTIEWCQSSDSNKQEVLNFLKASGDNSGITNIEFDKKDIPKNELTTFVMKLIQKNINSKKERANFQRITIAGMSHKMVDTNKIITFKLEEESAGTRKLFSLASVWLKAIKEGQTLIIDELNNSLHPLLAKFLIRMFHDKEINTNGAQLIFTGHDSFLLDLEIFRRDQIWFTEKNLKDETDLYCLAEYSPRKNEPVEKGYLKGRYGALPHIDETILS
ncbi:MAG: AAA family ATPase [Gammaproteobacteria bacterium]|nr:AAA family ATPase [Gammaproteobacteria bacterium]